MPKKAILAVSFGTSYNDTCDKNIGAIEREIAAAYPDWEVRRAFTSGMIIRKIRKRDNARIDTVDEALARLTGDGFDTVICQPTHIINGEEYEDIVKAASGHRAKFRHFEIGAPLLTSTQDYQELAGIIGEIFAPGEGTALCLMGHGSVHFIDSSYAALDYHFKNQGCSRVFVGTVEGFPDLETVMRHIKDSGAKKVVLTPLMVVAGDHATNDMAGGGGDSWDTAFKNAGFEVECVLKGFGEYAEIRQMYLKHVQAAIDKALG